MSTCKTCKWWKHDDKERYGHQHELGEAITVYRPGRPGGPYERQEIGTYEYGVRRCGNPRLLFYEAPPRDGAAVYDGSEYWASLVTGEDFGCSLHEAK